MTPEEEILVAIAGLQQRVEVLEEADKKHIEFRREYYQDREERIRREARLDVKLDNILQAIGTLVAWKETLVAKPAKKWEMITDKALVSAVTAIVTAIVVYFLARVGL